MIDYVFRVLGLEYLNRTDLAHVIDEAPLGQLTPKPHAIDMPVGKEHRAQRQAAGNGAEVKLPVQSRIRTAESDDLAGKAAHIQAKKLLGDAPACTVCGHITIRNGTCYKCVNCGTSMGCS